MKTITAEHKAKSTIRPAHVETLKAAGLAIVYADELDRLRAQNAELEAARAVTQVVHEILRDIESWKDEKYLHPDYRHRLTFAMGAYDAAVKAREAMTR